MLRLPGEFVSSPEILPSAPNHVSTFVSSFQKLMRSQAAAPSIHHPSSSSFTPFVPKALKDASMVLVRVDGVRRPLQPPYDGPYPVLEAGEKVFKIMRNGLPYTVSIDRIKPCNVPLTPLASSLIPNRARPPLHPSDTRVRRSPVHPVAAPVPPMVRIDSSPAVVPQSSSATPGKIREGPSSSSSSSPDISSQTEFPPLKTPTYTLSGRQSKPRVRLDL